MVKEDQTLDLKGRNWNLDVLDDEDETQRLNAEDTFDFTDDLLLEMDNVCPVTDLPYSTPELKKQLVEIAETQIKEGKQLLCFQVEIDRMKKLNDDLGHKGTNVAMKRYFANLRKRFGEAFPDLVVTFYRPRAGGDKVRINTWVPPQQRDQVFQQSLDIFNSQYQYHQAANQLEEIPEADVVIKASAGYPADVHEELYNNPKALVEVCEEEAREAIASVKMELIEQEMFARFEKLKQEGEKFEDPKEEVRILREIFIDIVAEEWGTIRLSEENLRKLLWSIFARMMRNIVVPVVKTRVAEKSQIIGIDGGVLAEVASEQEVGAPVQVSPTLEQLQEVEFSPGTNDLSETLKKRTRNECPVTHFPFEVPEARQRVIEFIETALKNGRDVVYSQIDLDKLSQLNSNISMEEADAKINEQFSDMRIYLKTVKGIDFIAIRPQAGGDEMGFAVSFDPSLFSPKQRERFITRLKKIFDFSFCEFVYLNEDGMGEYFPITGSVGIADARELLTRKADISTGELLQELEAISEVNLKLDKLRKAFERIKKGLDKAQGKDVKEFINAVVKEWGSTRTGANALRVILEYINAMIIQYFHFKESAPIVPPTFTSMRNLN